MQSLLSLPSLHLVAPELVLGGGTLLLLMLGAFLKTKKEQVVHFLSLGLLVLVGFSLFFVKTLSQVSFNGFWVSDFLALGAKVILVISTFILMLVSSKSWKKEGVFKFEYPLLMLLALLGMMVMVSAHDLMTVYMALEIMSLSLYVMAAFNRDNYKSSEAAVKYFVLGAFASCMTLYGMSLVYGYLGTTNFDALSKISTSLGVWSYPALLGALFVFVGFAFKLSLAPFHNWTPDVYEGVPLSVTAYFSTVPKVASFVLLIRLLQGPLYVILLEAKELLFFLGLLSMLIGALGALRQKNIKRLLAFSAIHSTGFLVLGLTTSSEGFQATLIYLLFYLVSMLGIFISLLHLDRRGKAVATLEDLQGLSYEHPATSLILGFLVFSLAGIPPLPGFFAKVAVLQTLLGAHFIVVAVLAVILSVIAAYYYLKVIQTVMIDNPLVQTVHSLKAKPEVVVCVVIAFLVGVMTLCWIYPHPIMSITTRMVRSLMM